MNNVRTVESTVLFGRIQCVDGTTVIFVEPPEEPGGSSVREPRRPKPTAPATSAAVSLPS